MRKTNNKHKLKFLIVGFVVVLILAAAFWYFNHTNIAVLNPKGPIALQEYHLIVLALALSLIVVIPVFALTFGFAYKYRETNQRAKYSPELHGNKFAETIWWVIPTALIVVLGIITWKSTHELDPYKPIASSRNPLLVQVVALDWKWLFIYPQQNVASVNFFQIPTNTPVHFEITSDAPMNSFWLPQLGGQIYAMPGMSTQLNLLASYNGSYNGSSANISGVGFSGMTFVAKASSVNDFNSWVKNVKKSPNVLNLATYNKLSLPSQNNPNSFYASSQSGLYNTIVARFNVPPEGITSTNGNTDSLPLTAEQLNQTKHLNAMQLMGMEQ